MTHTIKSQKTSKMILDNVRYTLDLVIDALGSEGYYLQEEEPGKVPTDPLFISGRQAHALKLLMTSKA